MGQPFLETLAEIHSCISLIEQASGLRFNLPAEIGDLTFQLCNMGGELVSVEGLDHCVGKPDDPGLLDEARCHTTETRISLQLMIEQG